MELIGMLDSPYVRRVAISLIVLGVPFKHRAVSVFRTFEEFRSINPVVKAPTAVTADGVVLMDSTLILQYAEATSKGRSLMPAAPDALAQDLRTVGLSLAACEKAVQLIYERALRPADKQHQPWVERVTGQLLAAFGELESQLARRPPVVSSAEIGQATITAAVAWRFTRDLLSDAVPAARYPVLASLSADAEQWPEFMAAPHGDGTVAVALTSGSSRSPDLLRVGGRLLPC
jgi:glutathione S-transferase